MLNSLKGRKAEMIQDCYYVWTEAVDVLPAYYCELNYRAHAEPLRSTEISVRFMIYTMSGYLSPEYSNGEHL